MGKPANRPIHAILTAALLGSALAATGCSDGKSASTPARESGSSLAQRGGTEETDYGLGGDESGVQPGSAASQRGTAGGASSGGAPGKQAASTGPWSIVLRTFSREGHADRAAAALNDLRAMSPLVSSARIEPIADGSTIVVGRYPDAADTAAQRDLKRLKGLSIGSSRPFAQAMLTRIGPPAKAATQFDLAQLRKKYPTVDPLYTLQVAVWGNFESGTMSIQEVRRLAEEYCIKLRGQGFEAYVHHSDSTALSKVTVGAFDHNAFDPASGLRSPELEALMKKFPTNLVNGEPVQEANVPKFPKKYGYHTQRSQLVEVPK